MAPPSYPSRGAWRFTNVTRAFDFWPTLESIAIAAEHPDMVSAFTCRVIDADAALALQVEDEVVVTLRGERLWAGHLKSVGQDQLSEVGPRVWDLSGQDYTAKLDDAVVRRRTKRKKESARRRIRWRCALPRAPRLGTRGPTGDAAAALDSGRHGRSVPYRWHAPVLRSI
jgi:hypothetical protein